MPRPPHWPDPTPGLLLGVVVALLILLWSALSPSTVDWADQAARSRGPVTTPASPPPRGRGVVWPEAHW